MLNFAQRTESNALRLLCLLWLGPLAALVWSAAILPMQMGGLIRRIEVRPTALGAAVIFVIPLLAPSWWRRMWGPWAGLALPYAVILKRAPESDVRTFHHELRHVDQWCAFGLLFPFLYGLAGVAALLNGASFYNGNLLEVDAQMYAARVLEDTKP